MCSWKPRGLLSGLRARLRPIIPCCDAESRVVSGVCRMQHHPDKVSGEEEKVAATKRFTEIAEAYEILSDDEKRGKYDRGEEIKPEGQQQGSPFQNPFAQHMHFRH